MIITASTLAETFRTIATKIDGYTLAAGPHDDQAVQRLTNADGRTIGGRARTEGTTLQLWITAPRTPAAPPSPGRPRPLRPGRSYHTVLNLLDLDGDPAEIIHGVLTRDLLPAFDTKPYYVGHRPWDAAATAARRPNWEATGDTEDEPAEAEAEVGVDAIRPPTQEAAPEPTHAAESDTDSAQPPATEIAQPARTPKPTPAPAAKKATPAKTASAQKAKPTKTPSAKKPPAAKKTTASAKKATAPAKKATATRTTAPAKKTAPVKPTPRTAKTATAKTATPATQARARKPTTKTTSPR